VKSLLAFVLFVPLAAIGAETGYRLDKSPHEPTDLVSLQTGAKLYVNYCLGCHSMQYVRYGGLEALGLTEQQIKDNLLFTGEKVGEPMKGPMDPKTAKQWFGVAPPDLSVVSRSRGTDWLYTYLRTFYRDSKTVTGWKQRGVRERRHAARAVDAAGRARLRPRKARVARDHQGRAVAGGVRHCGARPRQLPGLRSRAACGDRKTIGIVVLFALGVLFILAYLLKKEFWKDVK
jgi:ubiquinol-cytochrome c reductase cytochrome c1 subunit